MSIEFNRGWLFSTNSIQLGSHKRRKKWEGGKENKNIVRGKTLKKFAYVYEVEKKILLFPAFIAFAIVPNSWD